MLSKVVQCNFASWCMCTSNHAYGMCLKAGMKGAMPLPLEISSGSERMSRVGYILWLEPVFRFPAEH